MDMGDHFLSDLHPCESATVAYMSIAIKSSSHLMLLLMLSVVFMAKNFFRQLSIFSTK